MIGSSDGKQYESPLDVELGNHIVPDKEGVGASRKPTGALKQSDPMGSSSLYIDREHDVPLAASALHKDGQMYGVAIDKDAPIRPEYDQYIHKHEHDEFHYMKDLITNGMDPKEAYRKAHDHITPMESARVQADLGEKGLEDYKQYWRDVSKISGEKENPDRHPDAHTTTFGLDEAELGKKYAVFQGVKGAARQTLSDASPQPINPMTPSYIQPHPGGRTGPMPWYRGAEGKWRQEIPDNKSKLTVDKARQADKDKGVVTLGDALHHPELYKSYPSIKNIKIFHDPEMRLNNAVYQPSRDEITLGPHSSEEQLRSTLLHEIQHAIQTREGFTAGSSPTAMIKPVAKAMESKGMSPTDYDPKILQNTIFDAYSHVGGEIEARNVEKRKDFPDEALRMFKPSFTQEFPYEKQLNPPID